MPIINVVIDLSHHNTVTDFGLVKADGIIGIIHEATQGFDYIDPTFSDHRNQALAAGLFWGAYHFGVGGDGVAQADQFLTTVNPRPNDLLVLDLEANPGGSSMTLDEASDFRHTRPSEYREMAGTLLRKLHQGSPRESK
jgi:lysozyme